MLVEMLMHHILILRWGAALLLENGEVVIGSNQENASYPSGLCAERVAIYHAGAQFPNQKILKWQLPLLRIIKL